MEDGFAEQDYSIPVCGQCVNVYKFLCAYLKTNDKGVTPNNKW